MTMKGDEGYVVNRSPITVRGAKPSIWKTLLRKEPKKIRED